MVAVLVHAVAAIGVVPLAAREELVLRLAGPAREAQRVPLLDLRLTTTLLQGFIAVAALVLVVVFQDDLRRAGVDPAGLNRVA